MFWVYIFHTMYCETATPVDDFRTFTLNFLKCSFCSEVINIFMSINTPKGFLNMALHNFFITKGRYIRCVEWYYGETKFESCSIVKLTNEPEDEFNFVGAGGNEGADIAIFDTLEEAIYKSQYKKSCWDKIDLSGLCDYDKEKAQHFIKISQNPDIYEQITKEYNSLKNDKSQHKNLDDDININEER